MEIGARIKEIRKSLGITQQALADRLGLKRNTIANYEIGQVQPSDRTISDICREFSVNEAWLRTGEGQMFADITRQKKIAAFLGSLLQEEDDDFKLKVIEAFCGLTPEERELLRRLAHKITEGDR